MCRECTECRLLRSTLDISIARDSPGWLTLGDTSSLKLKGESLSSKIGS